MASIGLYFYRARYYDPVLSRFTSADSIIPGVGDAQAWDRYAFVNNNPLYYTDPDGHIPLLVTAAIGAFIGAAVNYSLQVVNNINTNHMDIQEAMSWSNIDKKSFVVSTVGGFVGGLTLGATTMACGALGLTEGTTAVVESVIGGGLSNILSGQAQALTGSAIDQFVNHTSINEGMLYFKPNASEFLNDAEANGFLSADQIAYDGGVGAVLGTLGGFGKKIIADLGIPDPLYLSRQPNVLVRPATNAIDFLVEYGTQTTSRTKEQAR